MYNHEETSFPACLSYPNLMKPILRLLFLSTILVGSNADMRSQTTESTSNPIDYWAIENAAERAKLPLYKTIPAAKPHELTPSNELPPRSDYRDWYRSHGDHSGSRYSGLTQIDRSNVKNLKLAWIYRSQDMPKKSAATQTNPIIVNGVMYLPTVGHKVVAVDAANGKEIWRFDPGSPPSQRGIFYWDNPPGGNGDRIVFTSDLKLIALIASFGEWADGHPTSHLVNVEGYRLFLAEGLDKSGEFGEIGSVMSPSNSYFQVLLPYGMLKFALVFSEWFPLVSGAASFDVNAID